MATCGYTNGINIHHTNPTYSPSDIIRKDFKSELMNYYQTNKFSLPYIQINNPVVTSTTTNMCTDPILRPFFMSQDPKYIEQKKNFNFNHQELNNIGFNECGFSTRLGYSNEHPINNQCNLPDLERYIHHSTKVNQLESPNYGLKRALGNFVISSNVDTNKVHCSSRKSRKIIKSKGNVRNKKVVVTDSQNTNKMSPFENEDKDNVFQQNKPEKKCQMKKQASDDELNFYTQFNCFHNHNTEIPTERSNSNDVQNINSILPVENTIENCHENCNFCNNKPNCEQTIKNNHDSYGIDMTDISNHKFVKYCLETPNKVFKNYKILQLIKNNTRTLQNNDCLLLHHLKIYENINNDIKKFTINESKNKKATYYCFYVEKLEHYLQNYKFINVTQMHHKLDINLSDVEPCEIISLTQFLNIENCLILTEACKRDNVFFYKLNHFVKNNFFTDDFEFDILYAQILLNVHKIDEKIFEKLNYSDIKLFIIKIIKESFNNTLLHFIELPGLIFYLKNSNGKIIYNNLFKDFNVYLSLLNVLAALLKFDWNQVKNLTELVVENNDNLYAYSKVIATFEKYRQIFYIVLLYVVRPFLTPLLYLQAWQKNVLRNIYSKYYYFVPKINYTIKSFRPKIFFFQLIDLVLYTNKNIYKYQRTSHSYVQENKTLLYFLICNYNNTKLKKFFIPHKRRTKLMSIFKIILQTLNVIVAGKVNFKHSVFIETLKITVERLIEVKKTKFKYNAFEALPINIDKNDNNGNHNLKCCTLISIYEISVRYFCRLYMLFYTDNKNIDILFDKKMYNKNSKETGRQTIAFN
ncbi:hypothetical protein COBT_002472 [Conglomerata obtusa]